MITGWTGHVTLRLSLEGDRADCSSCVSLGPWYLHQDVSYILWVHGGSVTCVAAICWASSIGASGSRKLGKLVERVGSVLRIALELLDVVVQRGVLPKLMSIKNSTAHPLHGTALKQSAISVRLLQLRCNTETYKMSFLTAAITTHHESLMIA